MKRDKPPFYNFEFVIVGLKESEKTLTALINKLGGKVVKKVHNNLAAVISTPEQVEKMPDKIKEAQALNIQIVPEEYVDCFKEDNAGAITYIRSRSICNWGTDPSARIPKDDEPLKSKSSIYTKSVPKSTNLTVMRGTAVDPDSRLLDCASVYVDGKNKYTVVLGETDIKSNKNFKLQLLKADRTDT